MFIYNIYNWVYSECLLSTELLAVYQTLHQLQVRRCDPAIPARSHSRHRKGLHQPSEWQPRKRLLLRPGAQGIFPCDRRESSGVLRRRDPLVGADCRRRSPTIEGVAGFVTEACAVHLAAGCGCVDGEGLACHWAWAGRSSLRADGTCCQPQEAPLESSSPLAALVAAVVGRWPLAATHVAGAS